MADPIESESKESASESFQHSAALATSKTLVSPLAAGDRQRIWLLIRRFFLSPLPMLLIALSVLILALHGRNHVLNWPADGTTVNWRAASSAPEEVVLSFRKLPRDAQVPSPPVPAILLAADVPERVLMTDAQSRWVLIDGVRAYLSRIDERSSQPVASFFILKRDDPWSEPAVQGACSLNAKRCVLVTHDRLYLLDAELRLLGELNLPAGIEARELTWRDDSVLGISSDGTRFAVQAIGIRGAI